MSWTSVQRPGVAIYPFEANGKHQISLSEGVHVFVQEELSGWYRGTVQNKPGIFPATYVKILPLNPEAGSQKESVQLQPRSNPSALAASNSCNSELSVDGSSSLRPLLCLSAGATGLSGGTGEEGGDSALCSEISAVLKTWRTEARQHMKEGRIAEHETLMQRTSVLLQLRRRLFVVRPSDDSDSAVSLSNDHRSQLRRELVELLESSRRNAHGFMVPRTRSHEAASLHNTGVLQLLKMHKDMFVALQREASTLWHQKIDERRAAMCSAAMATQEDLIKSLPSGHFNLALDVKACLFSVGQSTQVYFQLYTDDEEFISEEYVVELTAAGMPQDIALLGKMKGVFLGLDKTVLRKQLYLIVRIYRVGALLTDSKSAKKRRARDYRRPFGCSVLSLSLCDGLYKSLGEEYCPANDRLAIYRAKDPVYFPKLHQMIIAGLQGVELAPKTKGFAIGLTLTKAAQTTVNDSEKAEMKPLALHKAVHPGDVRNDFYVTLLGGDFLQDKKKSAKNVEVRVQVVTRSGYVVPDCIVRGAGPAAPARSEYCSAVYYHCNSPELHETLRLRLDASLFAECHLLVNMWHVSSNADKNTLFSFAFLPLTCRSGAVIADGHHDLPCYAPLKDLASGKAATMQYLTADESVKPDRKKSSAQGLVRRREEFRVHTRLSSVTMTQLDSLHALFNWRSLDASQVSAVMTKFLMISGSELVKFVRETFDSLFAMLCIGNYKEEVASQVFVGLLYTIDQLTTRMTSWRPTVTSYVNDVFKASGVHVVLLEMCISTVEYAVVHSIAKDMKRLKKLTMFCKCIEYMLKFIIASFSVQLSDAEDEFMAQRSDEEMRRRFDAEQEHARDNFKKHLMNLLDCLTDLLARHSGLKDPLVGCKAFILKSFSSTLKDLSTVYSPTELGRIVDKVLASVDMAEQSKLSLYKLRLIGDIVESEGGSERVSWTIIRSTVLSALKSHLSRQAFVNEQYLSVGVLTRVLQMLQQENEGGDTAAAIAEENADAPPSVSTSTAEGEVALSSVADSRSEKNRSNFVGFRGLDAKPFCELLPELTSLVLYLQSNQALQHPLVSPSEQVLHMMPDVNMLEESLTTLWTILYFVESADLQGQLALMASEKLPQLDGTSVCASDTFMRNLLDVCSHAFELNIYPSIWIVLRSFQLSVIARVLKELSSPLCGQLCRDQPLDVGLWSRFLKVSVGLATHPDLMNVSDEQRQFVSSGIRVDCLALTREVWAKAVSVERQPDLAGFFCQDMLVALSEGGAHDLAMDMLHDLIVEEHSRTGELAEVSRYAVDALDAVTNHSQDSAKLFVERLCTSLTPRLASVMPAGTAFLSHLQTLFQLMCDLFRFPNTEAYEHERTSVVIRLLQYLQSGDGHARRKAMLYRYMQYLVELHVSVCSFAEAGITQLQQANLLDWSEELVPAHGTSPAESEMERKERLLLAAISLFVDGQCWERAIGVCELLRQHYEHGICDYAKLAMVLERQALFYRNVIDGSLRFYPAYFRVVFYCEGGRDEYVYRGGTLESVMDFSNRIRSKYIDAYLLMSSDEPSEALMAEHRLIITVTTLTLSNEAELRGEEPAVSEQMLRLPPEVARFRENDDIDIFVFSKAENRSGEKKPANEFKDLWVTRTYIRCEETFPSNRKRIGVVERHQKLIEPADVAVNTIRNKNKELLQKMEQVQMCPEDEAVDVGPLSMNLNGILDAAVNGGTRKYIEAFLSETSDARLSSQAALKQAMVEQQRLLRKGLEIFAARKHPALDPLYNRLRELFHRMVNNTTELLQ